MEQTSPNRWPFGREVARVLGLAWLALVVFGCEEKQPVGFVHVQAPSAGSYEIYRIASESPLQFVSEQIGYFNRDIALAPGSYLILADCSSQPVIIRPQSTEKLIAHQVDFVPPRIPGTNDKFSIQCNRYDQTRSRQYLTNRYNFHVLDGERDLLVGMVPLHINFKAMANPGTPKVLSYKLSAIQIASFEGMDPSTAYFVSPAGGLIAVTEPQDFGHWQYLLPGRYTVEVNGTIMSVELSDSEERIIKPAFLKISSPPEVDLGLSSQIRGTPIFVELNNQHWLNLNEVYPVLPGPATIRINGSSLDHVVNLIEGQLTEKTARSVTVHDNCSPWEWTCLGSRSVVLYEDKKLYPFAEGVTDVPILFFEDKVAIGIQGSRDIRYNISKDKLVSSVTLGKVRFVPEHHYRPGQVTDLVRVEAIQHPYSGNSLDLDIERETVMPLVTGQYYLSQYVTLNGPDSDRRLSRKIINATESGDLIVHFPVFVTEKKLIALEAAKKKRKQRERKRLKKLYSQRYHPAIPLKYE